MEQNKELRFLVDTMLKTYDQLNKQIAEELSVGTPIPAKEIMRKTSEKQLEDFYKSSEYDKENDQPFYLFETRGFAQKYEDSGFRYHDVYKDFLDSFSEDELLELIDKTCEEIREIRRYIGRILESRTEDFNRKKSA